MDIEVNPKRKAAEEIYRATPVLRTEHAEGGLTRLVEQQSAKVSSHLFLFAALGSMAASAWFELSGRKRLGEFIGMWPGPLLTMGVYNKLVKTFGGR